MLILDHSELKDSLKAEKDVANIVLRVMYAIIADVEIQLDNKPLMLKVLRAYREDAPAIADAAAKKEPKSDPKVEAPKAEPKKVSPPAPLKIVHKVISKPVAHKAKRR